jgi:glycosyltransferase involved in cell wall biosynthesis
MSVTIIVPTTCEAPRAAALERAVLSVVSQLPAGGRVLVVANGSRVDQTTLRKVAALPRTDVGRLEQGNVAQAQRYGRTRVATPFFGFLDDDDEYLPGAIDARLSAMQDDEPDVVVTNGYARDAEAEYPVVSHMEHVRADPLRSLLSENWLASCSAMFRTATVSETYFDGRTRFFEWTLIAYRIASTRTIRFVDAFTYRIHSSDASASKSAAYRAALPGVLGAIAALDLPDDVRAAVHAKISHAEHVLSAQYLEAGQWRSAMRHHLRSLIGRGGLRFLPYSRRLLFPRMRDETPSP